MEDGDGLFCVATEDRTGRSGLRLQQGKCRLDVGKNHLTGDA